MDDKELFAHALGVQPPWRIKDVRIDVEAQRVEVEVECAQTVWADPQTKARVHVHGYEPRTWRHLDTMQFETFIQARVPRLKYPDGHTELLPIPWAEPHSRHTLFLKHGPSRFFRPAAPFRTAADCCG
jgi:transposase